MWFGNLVTMEWFNDVWMKEVFANFMAAKIVNPIFPEVDHDLRFMLAHYPAAYGVDRTTGANPIRQTLENLNEAGAMYGAIIYQKAPVVMKHLELMMGESTFRDGLREYLGAHRYANATWPDLVEVMDARADDDLLAWSQIWVNEPGRPTIKVELQTDGEVISSLTLSQTDPFERGRLWNQRLTVLLGSASGAGRNIDVHLTSASAEVPEAVGVPLPDFVLPNGGGIGYGGFLPDARSRDWLLANLPTLPQPRRRAVGWLSLWDSMLEGQTHPTQLLDLALRSLPPESDELNIEHLLGIVSDTYWRYIDSTARRTVAPRVEALLWELLEAAPRATLKGSYFATYRDIALTVPALERIRAIWAGEIDVEGLKLSETDMMAIAQGLAVRGILNAEAILDAQRERIENSDNRRRFAFVRPALSADDATRAAFFDSLSDPANREQEPWVLEAVAYLNHPLRAPESLRYIRPALEELEEVQRTAGIFFPLDWLNATFGGHSSREAADTVRTFLLERSDLALRLRGKLLQAADPLFRAAAIIHGAD
jgi:aminopeptidase N